MLINLFGVIMNTVDNMWYRMSYCYVCMQIVSPASNIFQITVMKKL